MHIVSVVGGAVYTVYEFIAVVILLVWQKTWILFRLVRIAIGLGLMGASLLALFEIAANKSIWRLPLHVEMTRVEGYWLATFVHAAYALIALYVSVRVVLWFKWFTRPDIRHHIG